MSFQAGIMLVALAGFGQDDPSIARSRIVFGSCIHQDKAQPVWDSVAALKPDLFIFAGDNIYADTKDMDVLRKAYQKQAEQPGFARLKKIVPVIGTWDDHDYGTDDAGADFAMREGSQQVFLDFFGVPKDDPRRKREGVYSSQIYGPPDQSVQVILLDTRYHRSPLRKKAKQIPGEGPYEASFDKSTTFLGEEQWKWLGEELKKPAKVRLIVSSIQLVSQNHGWEKWQNLPHERERFFKLLQETKAEGVIILSGDRHHAELSVLDTGISYPLFDLTSSGMNEGFKKWRFPENNPARVSSMFHGNNFGAILIDWTEKDPIIRLQIRDDSNEVCLQEKFPLSLLKPGLMKSQPAVATKGVAKIDGEPVDVERLKTLMNKEVTLEMRVAASGANKNATMIFLNSESDRNSATNLTVVLNKKVQDAMKAAGMDDPRKHFAGKTVRVVGPLSTFQERPQIILADPSKITMAE